MGITFELRLAKKRRRDDLKRDLAAPVASVFRSTSTLQEEDQMYTRVRRRVELLEDAEAKVKRLKDEGNTLAEAGRFRAAMGRWREALSVDTNNATLYELLAQASMSVYEDFEAVQFARKATELAPKWSDGFHTLARCQLNFGELTLALQALKKAVELNEDRETAEMRADRQDIEMLLVKQEHVLRQRDEEAAKVVEPDKLQVIYCFKHLSLRAKAIIGNGDPKETLKSGDARLIHLGGGWSISAVDWAGTYILL